MMIRMLALTASALTILTVMAPPPPAQAGAMFMSAHKFSSPTMPGGYCPPAMKPPIVNKTVTFNKTLNLSKNIVINKPVTIFKPVTIEKNINIEKNIDLSKTIDINKNVEINKTIIINKGNEKAEAFAEALAVASASASAAANANAFAYARGGYSYVTVQKVGGEIGQLAVGTPETACVKQWASLVRSIHAECVDKIGEHHPATRMIPETWVDSSTAEEIFRCLEGSSLEVKIGDVVQSDRGLAGIYQNAEILICKPGEALRHFKDGLVKCAVAEKVPDCTERTNLRRYGLGDLFFTYQAQVCARPPEIADHDGAHDSRVGRYSKADEIQLSGMSLDGGVGYGQ